MKQSIQAQVNEVTQFATWLGGTLFLLLLGRAVGKMEKDMVNSVLDAATPKNIPLQIPQTEVPQRIYGLHASSVLIDGGETVPPQYSDLIGFIGVEPLPAHILMTLLPAVEVEVGEKKIDAVMRQLKAGVEGIVDSTQFRAFLTTMARFHEYSIGNQILIMLQQPQATRVAGFNTWKDLGRWVRKGEKGIAIMAPIMPPRAICPRCNTKIPKGAAYCPGCGEPSDADMASSPRRFKVVHVFDVDQTEGEPLPEFEVPVLTGEVNERLFADLLNTMREQDMVVSFTADPHLDPAVKGYYRRPNEIWVRPEEPRAQQLKTLLHEISHYYSEGVFSMPRQDAETIAESAAFVVGAHYGFDTGVRSFPYVALWAQDKKVLESNLGAIRKVATTIMQELDKGLKQRLPAAINRDDLERIAGQYGWWATKLAEAVCPHNDVACVQREARRLIEARTSR